MYRIKGDIVKEEKTNKTKKKTNTKNEVKNEDYFSVRFHSHGQRVEAVNRRWLDYRQ